MHRRVERPRKDGFRVVVAVWIYAPLAALLCTADDEEVRLAVPEHARRPLLLRAEAAPPPLQRGQRRRLPPCRHGNTRPREFPLLTQLLTRPTSRK